MNENVEYYKKVYHNMATKPGSMEKSPKEMNRHLDVMQKLRDKIKKHGHEHLRDVDTKVMNTMNS